MLVQTAPHWDPTCQVDLSADSAQQLAAWEDCIRRRVKDLAGVLDRCDYEPGYEQVILSPFPRTLPLPFGEHHRALLLGFEEKLVRARALFLPARSEMAWLCSVAATPPTRFQLGRVGPAPSLS